MGELKKIEYYDAVLTSSKEYRLPYKDSSYFVLWTQILQFIKKVEGPELLEIGCGSGQFAHYLYDEGYRNYHGFDFSPKAIELAERTVKQSFSLGDALDPNAYNHPYNLVIALEVLEHIGDDLGVIKNLKQGTNLVFSLPTFDDPAHVRWFVTPGQILKRYYRLVDVVEIVPIGPWFACFGIVKSFTPSLLNRIFKTRERVTPIYAAKLIYRRIKRCVQ